jgi:DNA-binding HxlR family transcriptional regulator
MRTRERKKTSMTKTADLPYKALFQDCPAVALLTSISNRWVSLTVGTLGACGSLRYGQLSREIPGVSQKMLTQTLRSLERDGMVTRTVTPTVPVRVDYELTATGLELYDLLLGIKAWAETNVDRVECARSEYDDRPEAP